MRACLTAAAAMLLSGCSEGEAPKQEEQAVAAKLDPGLYEVAGEVTRLASTDKTSPATKLAQGAKTSVQACVAAGGEIDPSLFAEAGDKCTASSTYARNGRLNMQYYCTRAGKPGNVMVTVEGNFTADSFEGKVLTQTGFVGSGDYNLTRKISGKHTGACPPAKPA